MIDCSKMFLCKPSRCHPKLLFFVAPRRQPRGLQLSKRRFLATLEMTREVGDVLLTLGITLWAARRDGVGNFFEPPQNILTGFNFWLFLKLNIGA